MTLPPDSPYRVLQRRAKAAGVSAKGSAEQIAAALAAHEAGSATTTADVNTYTTPTKTTSTPGKFVSKSTEPSGGGYDGGISLWPDGLAGISSDGIFNAIPRWVNAKLPAGHTSQIDQLGVNRTIETILKLKHFIWSPNLVWFAIALALHVYAPYDFESAKKGFAVGWMLKRFAINFAVAFAYYAFFYVGLYVLKLSGRKYIEGSYPTFHNMLHNMWYWSLAIVQWTWWEAVMVRLWASGTVGFVSLSDIKADPYLLAWNVLWVLLIPVWRDVHFYIAHRFLHVRSVYTYVHKLHHRNADPEPFSGMTMHPVEHLYYFSNAFTPSLYLSNLSPLIFTWNFIHLTIAPGAGHSGWEDHFQSDQYHYLHHAKFECNYGSPMSGCVDQALGTFREKLGKSEAYHGEWTVDNADYTTEATDEKEKKEKIWSPNGYLGLPESWDHTVYTLFWVALFPLAWFSATDPARVIAVTELPPQLAVRFPEVVAFTIAVAPIILAMALSYLSGDKMSWRWPFQKESLAGVFGLFLALATAACIVPVYHATLWVVEVAQGGAQAQRSM